MNFTLEIARVVERCVVRTPVILVAGYVLKIGESKFRVKGIAILLFGIIGVKLDGYARLVLPLQ
ncbi:MAG: hypothetical protein OXF50_17495 [Caldilineaceae bacterium]|nr:hypothetical protein [Caldilineaceae bacterium]MCY3993020.1 hypothetical protein [Caldilineaceae bacterium]MDE0079808.1 hypothetical protein [Caldilineaceae bacterium]